MRMAAPQVAAVAALTSCFAGSAVGSVDAYPRAASAYILAIDDHVVWARNADRSRPPASLAKLLTALVLLQGRWNDRDVVTVSQAAAAIEGTQIGLRALEQLRAGEALTAMLIRSANDACLALVEHSADSAEVFIARMNAMAVELGMPHSQFRTPCGLDAPGQHTTVSDLLTLARTAMRQPQIAMRVGIARAAIATIGGRHIAFTNNNALVGRLRGTIGVKSGFTAAAGKCVIALTERDGHQVWLVMLDAPNRWWTADAMITAAFSELERVVE
jgi:D-alanyl-D-alanine carboxypeptidase (penicillin-binding protein 5/6)